MQARALELGVGPLAAAREILDRFQVGARLQHVRQFVWRGGALQVDVDDNESDVCYALVARWADAVLEASTPATAALVPTRGTVLDGRWVRGEGGYSLRAGIELAVPSAIYIRSDRHASFVPFRGRPADEVERALEADLTAYIQRFLSACPSAPQATAAGAARLKHLGL